MKKYTIFIILFCFIVFFTSCKRCKDLKYCEKPEIGEKYFGMYKPNAYWIYTNKDSTIIDSVYITDYKIEKHKNELDECFEYDIITYDLNSMYISLKPIDICYCNSNNCEGSSYNFSIKENGFSIEAKNSSSQLIGNIQLTDTFVVPNNKTFNNVFCANNFIWYAPNCGIVQYITYDNSDTLFLKSFHK